MVKRGTRSDDRDPTAAVAAVLDAARRGSGGLGKPARRRLARLERRIEAALKAEAKRRRQLDDARVELADLVARVADLVQPAVAPDVAPTSASAPKPAVPKAASARTSAAPKPAVPKAPSARRSTAPKPAARNPAAARKPAAPNSAPAQPPAESAGPPALPRRTSRRGTGGSTRGPGS